MIWGDWLKKNYFAQKALPYEMLLKWNDPIGHYGSDVHFDEQEVIQAFKEMYKNDKALETQLVMIPNDDYSKLNVYLRSSTTQYELRKTRADIYTRKAD